MATTTYFHSRVEAVRAAREWVWGDVPFSKREYVTPKTRPDVAVWVEAAPGVRLPEIVFTAQVNKGLVAIHFDSYGRETSLDILR